MQKNGLRVVIADDHTEMLKVISAFLSQRFCVIAAVASGDDLIRTAIELVPDVIVSDIDMPAPDGLDAMLELKKMGVEIPFILLGVETKGIAQFLERGAAGYVHKYDIYADLVDAVLSARTGQKFVSRSAAQDCGK